MKYTWTDQAFVNTYEKVKANVLKNSKDNSELVASFLGAFEDFYYYGLELGIINKNNKKKVLERLGCIEKILPAYQQLRSIVGYTTKDKTAIYLNPELSFDKLKFSILTELAGIISSYDETFIKSVSHDFIYSLDDVDLADRYLDYLEYGFRLIEDSINFDMAENIIYKVRDVERPDKKRVLLPKVFGPKVNAKSNYRICHSFQELTILLGRTILKDSSNMTDEEILINLKRESINSNFIQNLSLTLLSIFGKEEMFNILADLGLLYRKEMAELGKYIYTLPIKVTEARASYNNVINKISEKNISKVRSVG